MDESQRLSVQLAPKILEGIQKAARKLLEQRAAENGTLIVLIDGKPQEVSARELLKKQSL